MAATPASLTPRVPAPGVAQELAHTAVQVQRNYDAFMDVEMASKGGPDRAQLLKRRMAFERKVSAGISAAARMLAKPFRGDSATSGDNTLDFLPPPPAAAPTPPPRAAASGGDGGLRAAAAAPGTLAGLPGGKGSQGKGGEEAKGDGAAEPAAPPQSMSTGSPPVKAAPASEEPAAPPLAPAAPEPRQTAPPGPPGEESTASHPAGPDAATPGGAVLGEGDRKEEGGSEGAPPAAQASAQKSLFAAPPDPPAAADHS